MDQLRAIIVDDEHHCRENLASLIHEYCPEIEVLSLLESAHEAKSIVEQEKPDVLFLDIRMPGKDGFELLAELDLSHMDVVFTTAHNEYVLRALKEGAIDYLEKPIDIDELENCVQRLAQRASQKDRAPQNLGQLLRLGNFRDMDKTTIPTSDGFIMVKSSEIVHLEANESYTQIYLSNGDKHLSSKNIRVFEEKLNPHIFFRTHKSHIVNLMFHLQGFSRLDGNVALMSNGSRVPISRRRLSEFMDRASR